MWGIFLLGVITGVIITYLLLETLKAFAVQLLKKNRG